MCQRLACVQFMRRWLVGSDGWFGRRYVAWRNWLGTATAVVGAFAGVRGLETAAVAKFAVAFEETERRLEISQRKLLQRKRRGCSKQ
jgi:hypothetical protein